jgi:tetratricopeptide (TPR) repeat protein
MSKIFISYSHKDEEWKDRLVTQLKVLEIEGFCTLWEDRKIEMGNDWLPEIEKSLKEAQIIIMMISADFLVSNFIRRVEVPKILERRKNEGIKVIPFIVKPCAWKTVEWLAAMELTPKDGKALMGFSDYEVEYQLALLAETIYFMIKPDAETCAVPHFPVPPPDNISISKLPTTGKDLFGRKKQLNFLDNAWADEHTHVVTLVAWGGVGKTALVNHWLNLVERKNYCGAKRVYGWSFYSRGAEEGKQASADEFMQTSLKWFGDPNPEEGSPVEKGRRLARLVREQKTLLVLDGMEPLQYPPGEVHGFDGKLEDQGMRSFLRELAGGQPGLCVITTREKVTDLEDKTAFSVKEMELEHLSEEAGVQLLESLEVKGSKKDILQAVKEYDGYALALTLLGRYIKSAYKGDIRKRDKIPQLTKERIQGRHARRVMEAYERWLGDSAEKNVLYIMGLFDRPAEGGAIETLKADPAIPGVTEQLQQLSEEDWEWALTNLRSANLLAGEDPRKPDTLDCHPLVREHFGQKLREQNPGGWQEAHKRLYHYFKDLPEKELPDTLQEMEPLFAAFAHGCKAGLHEEAGNDVYWKRISRENEHYIKYKLGAFGADLSALSHFFEVPWSQPAAGLSEDKKAVVLSWAAFGLRAVGRLQEAIQPMKAGLELGVQQEEWDEAARRANHLSELMLTLGEVSQAVDYARQSVIHADRSGDDFQKESKRTSLADALLQAGQWKEAEKWFREAEAMQKKSQPESPYLYSLWGFRYCNLLLGLGKYKEVMERAEKALEIVLRGSRNLLDIALNNLSLGWAWMMQVKEEGSDDFQRAMDYLNRAVAGLREAGYQEFLPRGLFARAECYRLQNQFSNAWDDLNEAQEIAELGSMKLHLVDYHLEAGRLREAEGKKQEAEGHFLKAKEMIEETGYYRRSEEAEKLRSGEAKKKKKKKKRRGDD